MTTKTLKASYTIPCSSSFRDAVESLAGARQVNVADLARSILLVVPKAVIRDVPDPGGPPPGDREETVLKSGPSAGKPWRRKPRLQVRLSPGYDVVTVRRALNLALQLHQGILAVNVEDTHAELAPIEPPPELREELSRLQAIVSVLMFDPLAEGVTSRAEALHVMGFAPTDRPDRSTVRARFRILATIHHPDSHYGSHQRMSQLNAAMEQLNR